jgi:AraC-like DNA-binding protein
MNAINCSPKIPIPFFKFDSHTHDNWEIIVHTESEAILTIEGEETEVRPGHVTVVPPGVSHAKHCKNLFRDIWFAAKKLNLPEKCFTVYDADGNIQTLLYMMIDVLTHNEPFRDIIADSLAETICAYILKAQNTPAKHTFVRSLQSTLCQNYTNAAFDLTAEINSYGFNGDYFRRCFKEDTGKTPHDFLMSLRVDHAKRLLAGNDYSGMVGVAMESGFSNYQNFATTFRKFTGTSPLKYRNTRYNGN